MSAPSTSGLSVELLLRVIDVKYSCFTLLYFTLFRMRLGLSQLVVECPILRLNAIHHSRLLVVDIDISE